MIAGAGPAVYEGYAKVLKEANVSKVVGMRDGKSMVEIPV